MGMFESIFGGGESKSESSNMSTTQRKTLRELLDTYSGQIGQGQPSYGGDRVASLTGAQNQALGGLGGFVEGAGPTTPQNIPLYNEAQTALGGILGGTSGATPYTAEGIENFYQSNIAQPATQQFQEFTKPEIREAFAGPGFWGSARATEQSRGAQDLSRFLGEQKSELTFEAEQANKGFQESAANRALSGIQAQNQFARQPGDINQQNIQTRGQIAQLSGVSQQQAQNEINASIQKFAEENRLTNPEDMQILMQLLGFQVQMQESSEYSTPGALAGITNFAKGGENSAAAAFV